MKVYLAVGIGGTIGAAGRYGISIIWGSGVGFPYDTLIANLIGCFLLGFLLNNAGLRQRLGSVAVSGLGTGLIGSFTTFSTFAVETVELGSRSMALAVGYVLCSVAGGIGLNYFAWRLAKRKQAVS